MTAAPGGGAGETARDRAVRSFREQHDRSPAVVIRGPGRVNVIGEHTDYNDGFVLPVAIDRELWIALEPSDDETVSAVSEAFDEPVTFRLDGFEERLEGWGRYLQGVAWALADAGLPLRGWRGALTSDIPVGAGLSSSAALELACATAFEEVAGASWDPLALAHHCRRAENEWVGVSSGIMDQVASAAGQSGSALLLDCRTVEVTAVPVPDTVALVVLDTATRRELADSGYNDRRRECDAAAEALGVDSLRDATVEMLDARRGNVEDVLWRRARHVVTENARTVAAADALRDGDLGRLGDLVAESHRSLRDDFEVSSDELDAIVRIASDVDGCWGARLTGGGFAGCAVAIVDEGSASSFLREVERRYEERTGRQATTHVCRPVDGAGVDWRDEGGGTR